MANYKVTDAELVSVADAIRLKGGTSASLAFPSGFVSAIGEIQSGGMSLSEADEGKVVYSGVLSVQGVMSVSQNSVYNTTLFSQVSVAIPELSLISKTISENGTYYPASDSADGFSQVVVSVSNSGSDNNFKQTVERTISSINESEVSVVGNYAFNDCSALLFVSMQNCKTIKYYGFSLCSSLNEVNFPECEDIYDEAFASCTALVNVSLPKCKKIRIRAFTNCLNLLSIRLPECQSISSSAFYNCKSLGTIILNKCNTIQGDAFRSCVRLSKLYVLAESVPTMNAQPFISTPIGGYSNVLGDYGSIYVPSSLYNSYLSANIWSNYATRIVSINDEDISLIIGE